MEDALGTTLSSKTKCLHKSFESERTNFVQEVQFLPLHQQITKKQVLFFSNCQNCQFLTQSCYEPQKMSQIILITDSKQKMTMV